MRYTLVSILNIKIVLDTTKCTDKYWFIAFTADYNNIKVACIVINKHNHGPMYYTYLVGLAKYDKLHLTTKKQPFIFLT